MHGHQQSSDALRGAGQFLPKTELGPFQDGPGQGVAVGLQPVRGKPQNHVAGADGTAVGGLSFFHHPHDGSDQVIILALVNPGHLGGLSADQRASGPPAPPHQTGENLPEHLRIQFSRADVIKKEKGFRPQGGDVVHAVVDEILPDGAVPAQLVGHLQLGAHPVDACHQHGAAIPGNFPVKTTAKAANSPDHPRPPGGANQGADPGLHPVAKGDVDPGFGVGVPCHPLTKETAAGLLPPAQGKPPDPAASPTPPCHPPGRRAPDNPR